MRRKAATIFQALCVQMRDVCPNATGVDGVTRHPRVFEQIHSVVQQVNDSLR